MASQSIIETIELTKRYKQQLAVDRLSFGIEEGEIFGFLGPNGAGKTTTLLMLLGLSRPTAGRARVCGFDPIRVAMNEIDRPQVIVVGIEAHVCVQQTVLDLRTMDYDVFVCGDAVGSRTATDYQVSLQRMRDAGAVLTTVESAMFELCERCDTDRFKQMLKVVKSRPLDGKS